MGIFDFYYNYSKPSAPKTAGAASGAAVNRVVTSATSGYTNVKEDKLSQTINRYNEARDNSSPTSSTRSQEITGESGKSIQKLPEQPEATMQSNKPDEYRITYNASFPSPDLTMSKLRAYQKGVPIELSTTNILTGKVNRQIINPPLKLLMPQQQEPVNEPFYRGTSEQVGIATSKFFGGLKTFAARLPGGQTSLPYKAVTGFKFLFDDIPRFSVKFGEAIRLRGEEQLSFYKNPKAYVKRAVVEEEGAYQGKTDTRYQKLYAFGKEEVAPTIGIYGVFKFGGPLLRVGGKGIGILKSPEARGRLAEVFLPQKRILEKPDLSLLRVVERGNILPKGPERIFTLQTEKINPDVLAKVRELEGADTIRSLSTPALEIYGSKSKAITIPGFTPKTTFPDSYISKQTTAFIAGERIQVVGELVQKGKIMLRALKVEQPLSKTTLTVKKVELVGRGGIQVQKIAEGIKPAGQVELIGRDLKQVQLPRPGRALVGQPIEGTKPGIRNPFAFKAVTKTTELVAKERILPGIRIIGKSPKPTYELLFTKTRGEGIEMKFFPESYKTQKFTREGKVTQATTYEFKIPEVQAAKAAQDALGMKYKNRPKFAPTESKPLFRDIIQFEKLGERSKKTPLKFTNESIQSTEQKTIQERRLPVLKEKASEFPGIAKTEAKTKQLGILERMKSKFDDIGKKLETRMKSFEKTDSGSILRIKSSDMTSSKQIPIIIPISDTARKQIPIIKPITDASRKQVPIIIPISDTARKQIPIIKPISDTSQKQDIKQTQTQIQKQKEKPFFSFQQVPRTKPPGDIPRGGGGGEEPKPVKLRIPIKLDKLEFFEAATGKERRQGYDSFAKQSGLWIKVNKKPLTKNEAIALGAEVVDNTTSAQFKIKKSQQKPSGFGWGAFSSMKFSKSKKADAFIEKNKFRIDSMGEFEGITVKGWLAQRKGFFRR